MSRHGTDVAFPSLTPPSPLRDFKRDQQVSPLKAPGYVRLATTAVCLGAALGLTNEPSQSAPTPVLTRDWKLHEPRTSHPMIRPMTWTNPITSLH